ncbi:hypothetical protein LN042_35910 [Kitasatospora sp. RB6PN24]|uniref:hypothetical protein n=1 Tax=Kitasatospora humi TaxID=2893891 RepID=UPI001E45AB44|nr:hypothetical protein [Kitasatospora humi]MCC9312380.1 hypothetical protein [Kitasatospora humi]
MLITGHANDPLTPSDDLVAAPGFWASYLLWLAEGEDFEPGPDLFGADGADADAVYERLSNPTAWPVFRLPMQHGHSLLIVHRNFAEDAGIDYYLTHPDWDRPGSLASIEGHFAGPGLAWRELIHIARNPGEGPGITEPHARLLLLLPTLGDADLPTDATATVASALAAIGTPTDATTTLAEALLDHPFRGDETWYFEGAGSPLSGTTAVTATSRVLLCGGVYSPRSVRFGLSPEQDSRLAEALGTAY